MAVIAPVVSISIDDPAVAGRIVRNYHHYARNWEFEPEPSDHHEPVWEHHGTEFIPAVKALGPRAFVEWCTMLLGDWQIEVGTGYWRRSSPALTVPRTYWLHYTRADPTEYGSICSKTDIPPFLHLRALRWYPAEVESGQTALPPVLEVQFLGDGDDYSYGIGLPLDCLRSADAGYRYPRLYRWESGESPTTATMVDELQGAAGLGGAPSFGYGVIDLRIEQLEEYLRIEVADLNEDWIVPTGSYPVTRGPVRIKFYGTPGMFNLQEMDWMRETESGSGIYPYAKPRSYLQVPDWMNNGPGVATYATGVGEEPAGTDILVTEDHDGGAGTRPHISFITGAVAEARPICYCIHQTNDPARTAATRSATDVTPNAIRWHRNSDWRNAWFEAEFDDPDEVSGAEMPAFGEAIFAIAADTGGAPPTPATRIIGYLDGAHGRRAGERYQGEVTATMRAMDHPAMRLQGRKFTRHMSSFENWLASDMFTWCLDTVGVRDDYINVDAAVDSNYRLPANRPPWERGWFYDHDTGIIQAFDEIFGDYFGLQWGWGTSGYFLRPRPTWTSGDSPAWTLDHDTATTADMVRVLDVEKATAELRNYMMVLAGDEGGFWYDADSLDDDTADNYIGDDAWGIDGGAETHDQASYMAAQRLKRLSEFDLAIEIQGVEKLDLEPDNFVKVQAGMPDYFPDGSIFRLLDEDGDAVGREAPRLGVSYTAGIVEYAE